MKTLAPIIAALAAFALPAARADVPPVDPHGAPARVLCGFTVGGLQVHAVHADKIIFRITGALQAVLMGDQAALNAVPRNTELDIKVLDDPNTVADLRGKVLSFLGAIDNAANRAQIDIRQVDYAMVCPTVPN